MHRYASAGLLIASKRGQLKGSAKLRIGEGSVIDNRRSNVVRLRTRLAEVGPDPDRRFLVNEMHQVDRSRKASIDKKAKTLVILNGATLVVSVPIVGIVHVGRLVPDQMFPALNFMAGIGVLCLLASLMIARRVRGRVWHCVVRFDGLAGPNGPPVDPSTYCRRVAEMVVETWNISQRWERHLDLARRSFRNGLAVLVPLAVVVLVAAP